MTDQRSVAIGGNSAYEHFHPTDDFSNMINSVEGPETCNTYNMLKLSTQFFQTEEEVRYVDFYEKGLYNHILSTQHPDHGGFVYFTPMRPGHYRVYSQPHTSFWCCVGSGLENHSKYGEFIYAHRHDELWVNLFIPSLLDWKEKGVKIEQQTGFPEESSTKLTIVDAPKPVRFALKLRYPTWVKSDDMVVSVNGKKQPFKASSGEFVTLERRWKKGDVITMNFVMNNHVEQMPDGSDYYAFAYGPIVLASKTGADRLEGLLADDSRGGHIAKGPQVPLREIPMVIGAEEALEALPERISAKELRFALHHVYHNKQMGNRELVPFYQVHDSRYILYWPQATTKEVAEEHLLQVGNAFGVLLDSLTIDRVNAGQQQPESDHGIQFESSVSGVEEGIQWREAFEWFSYRMNNAGSKARYLYVRYFDKERPSDFAVRINGQVVKEIRLDGSKDGLDDAVFPLPDDLKANEQLTIRFEAKNGRTTAKMVEVRLLSDKIDESVKTSF